MDKSEWIVAEFLNYCGYYNIVHEPDGNIPPDFLINGRIAVEVRRLNQNYEQEGNTQGLEEIAIPLSQKLEKLILSLGPPTHGISWVVDFNFQRSIEPWKKLEPKIKKALKGFIENAIHEKCSIKFGKGFELEIEQSKVPQPTFYILGGHILVHPQNSKNWYEL